ncbi:MAG TPA: hypothetical protein P5294_02190 [Smithellaceae bacterium]|nr:hypothetical protein [Smithellaceae bacterium]HRV25323.1 hypothetical protein [Smithellaceae bacterium]
MNKEIFHIVHGEERSPYVRACAVTQQESSSTHGTANTANKPIIKMHP